MYDVGESEHTGIAVNVPPGVAEPVIEAELHTGAAAKACCPGLTETTTEMAISRNREQMRSNFLIEKFYTKCRISLDAFGGQIRPGLPTWLGCRAP